MALNPHEQAHLAQAKAEQHKPLQRLPITPLITQPRPDPAVQAALQRQQAAQQELLAFTRRTPALQRQVAAPALTALKLQRFEAEQLQGRRVALQRQLEGGPIATPQAVELALQRQAERGQEKKPTHPQSNADWVTLMRLEAQQHDGKRMSPREAQQYTSLQRQVAQTLVQRFKADRQSPEARYAEYGGHLASLQRHPLSGRVADVTLSMLPRSEQASVGRAMQDSVQRQREEQGHDEAVLKAHAVQRQLAELDQEAAQPALERIQARRGAGNPLSDAVRSHLEHGLNHDMSGVRIHDDAEADKLAKSVNAVAFTTGQDIYFQSGKYDPSSSGGLELLAHEATHTVQQAQGKVGAGIDPDSGLEAEARASGAKLAAAPVSMPEPKAAHQSHHNSNTGAAVQRFVDTAAKKDTAQKEPAQKKAPAAEKDQPQAAEKAVEKPEAKAAPAPAPQVEAAPEPAVQQPEIQHIDLQHTDAPELAPVEVHAEAHAPAPELEAAHEPPAFAEIPEIHIPDAPHAEPVHVEVPQVSEVHAEPVHLPEPAAYGPAIQRAAAHGAPVGKGGLTPAQARANARAAASAIAAAANAAAARVNSAAGSSAGQITAQARSHQQSVIATGRTQASAVRSAAQQAQNSVRQSATKASSSIRSKAQSSVSKLAAQHASAAAKAAQTINTNGQKVTQTANQHASKATQTANQHASKATAKAQSASASVKGHAAGSSGIAPEVGQAKTNAGNKIATDAASKITPAGTQISSTTKAAGTQVSQGMKTKGTQIATGIRAQGPRMTAQLNAGRQAGQQAITQTATQSAGQLTSGAAQAGGKLASSAAQAQAKIAQAAGQQAAQLGSGGQQAAAKIKQHGAATASATRAAAGRIQAALANSELTAAEAARVKSVALGKINQAVGNITGKARNSGQKATSGLRQHATSLKSKLSRVGPQASAKLRQSSSQIGAKFASSVGKITPTFGKVTQGHQQKSQQMNTQLGSKLTSAVAKTGSAFQQGSSKMDADFGSKVGQEAQKLGTAATTATGHITTAHSRAESQGQAAKAKVEAEAKAKEASAKKDESLWDKVKGVASSVWNGLKSIGDWIKNQLKQALEMFTSPGFLAGLITGLVLGAAVLALTIATGGLALPLLIAIGAGVGAITSGVSTVVDNIANGRSWNEGLLKSMAIGGLLGGVMVAIPIGAAVVGGIAVGVGGGIAGNVLSGAPWDQGLLANAFMGGAMAFAGKKLMPMPKGLAGGVHENVPMPTNRVAKGFAKVTESFGNNAKVRAFGDKFNNVTGNKAGRVTTSSTPAHDNGGVEITGYKNNKTNVQHAENAPHQDIRIHQEEAAQVRYDASKVGKVQHSVEKAIGSSKPKVGTRQYELQVESRKYGRMAEWRENEAAQLPKDSARAKELNAQAKRYREQQAEYQAQAKDMAPDQAGTGIIAKDDYPNLTPKELREFDNRIASANTYDEAMKIRYERYTSDRTRGGKTPSDFDTWLKKAERIHENAKAGAIEENTSLDQLGVTNNNYNVTKDGSPRNVTSETVKIDGKEITVRPDGISDKMWLDIKLMSGEVDVYYLTEQIKGQIVGAGAEGKEFGIVLSGPSENIRPSGPLVSEEGVTVLHRNTESGEWFIWRMNRLRGKFSWQNISLEDAKKLVGGK